MRAYFLIIIAEFEVLLANKSKLNKEGPQFTAQDQFYIKSLECLKSVYGDESSALGDLLSTISASKAVSGSISESIDWAGKALLSRITNFGYVHSKTADSHYNLGLLYRLNFEFKSSLKELKICREIRKSLIPLDQLSIAECDFSIAYTAKLIGLPAEALLGYYLCARTRCKILGVSHAKSIQSLRVLYKQKDAMNSTEKILLGVEIKDKIEELGWDRNGQSESGLPINHINLFK